MLKKNPTTKWKKLDSKEIKPVNPKGNQPWIFIGRTAAEAPIVWPLDVKSWLIWKDPDAGKDWRWEEKGMTEGPRDGWMASLTQWTWIWANPGDSEGQGSLACYSPWSHKESDTTEWLSNNNHQVHNPKQTWQSCFHYLEALISAKKKNIRAVSFRTIPPSP